MKNILHKLIDKHTPFITKKVKGRLCPWLTADVKKEMNERDKLLRRARNSNNEILWSMCKRQRNLVSGLVKMCKSQYYRNFLNECANSPDNFLGAIKKIYPTKVSSSPIKNISSDTNGRLTCETKMIADSFCKYFSTIANSLKFKSIHLRYFIWGKVPKEINNCGTFFKFHRVNDVDV